MLIFKMDDYMLIICDDPQTIVLIPVLPHGVVQLASLEMVFFWFELVLLLL